ncbi:hypothetical protein GCM10009093_15090 [Brevundimonas terrae]|uniref:Uncharacterized protein n=1 Tax=Brevundimonas terrae TaxID=363631 RepID=A0ABP3I4V3_9CAUL
MAGAMRVPRIGPRTGPRTGARKTYDERGQKGVCPLSLLEACRDGSLGLAVGNYAISRPVEGKHAGWGSVKMDGNGAARGE